jgi:hypothetical protein
MYQQILKAWDDEELMNKYRSQDEWKPVIAKLEKNKRFRANAIQHGKQLAAAEERGELSESTKSETQWSIHQQFLPNLPGYVVLGPEDGVDLSTEKLEEITARWTKILQGSLIELMKNFEELTKNLNAFFTSKERDKSIAKAGEARDNAKDMRRNLNSVQKQKEAEKAAKQP